MSKISGSHLKRCEINCVSNYWFGALCERKGNKIMRHSEFCETRKLLWFVINSARGHACAAFVEFPSNEREQMRSGDNARTKNGDVCEHFAVYIQIL